MVASMVWIAGRTKALDAQFRLLIAVAGRQVQGESGLQFTEAEDLAAGIAMKMGMTMLGLADRVVAPAAIFASDPVRDAALDQPVEDPVKGDPVERPGLAQMGLHFGMAEGVRCRQEGFQYAHPRRRGAAMGLDEG